MYAHADRLYNRSYEVTGIPQAQAEGNVPDNLDSGAAQEKYLAITDQRMQVAIHRYHFMFLELARRFLTLGRKIAKTYPEYGVKAAVSRGKMKKIFLKEQDLRDDEYVLKMWPTNALSDDPGQRETKVEKWANAGWVSPDQAKRLLDFPDLDEAQALDNSSFNLVEDMIANMLEEGRYMAPVPYLDIGKPGMPGQAVIQVRNALLKAWNDNRPEDRLQLLRDWLEDAQNLIIPPAAMSPDQNITNIASAGGTPAAAAPAAGVTPMLAGAGAPPPGAPPPGPLPPPMAA
jgi:hypothetical protein